MIWKIALVMLIVGLVGGLIQEFAIESKARRIIKERDNLNLKTAYGRQQKDRLNREIDKLYGFR